MELEMFDRLLDAISRNDYPIEDDDAHSFYYALVYYLYVRDHPADGEELSHEEAVGVLKTGDLPYCSKGRGIDNAIAFVEEFYERRKEFQ